MQHPSAGSHAPALHLRSRRDKRENRALARARVLLLLKLLSGEIRPSEADIGVQAVAWNSGAGRVRKLAMNTSISTPGPGGEVVVYESRDGEARVDVRFDQDTVWLTRQQIAELFGRDRSVVTRHIRNAYRERELDPKATSAKFARVQSEGERSVSREVDHYNLDMIMRSGVRDNDQGAVTPPNIQLILSMAHVMSIRLPSSRLDSL